MTGAEIFVAYSPLIIKWISDLAKVWTKDMTPEEVKALASGFVSDYEAGVMAAGGRPIMTPDQLAALTSRLSPEQVVALQLLFPPSKPTQ